MARGGRQPGTIVGTKKFAPLVVFLAHSEAAEVVLTFAAIETLIGLPLSLAARIESAFWTTEHRAHVRALTEAGWEGHLDRRKNAVRFRRIAGAEPERSR